MGITVCLSRKCGRPGCRGLRMGAKFDIQLETEDSLKNSSGFLGRDGVKKGVFELACDHHRELESELKKMAPPNGRAVLLFRGRCGCSVGRMEVPGPRKPPRKVMGISSKDYTRILAFTISGRDGSYVVKLPGYVISPQVSPNDLLALSWQILQWNWHSQVILRTQLLLFRKFSSQNELLRLSNLA
ncbi:hypothetical protein RHSIM_Rhsim10G0032900 [Rhododendron simsii]|uniref:Uncharacterized protein n=1 Tax=Rhododendron simsii TaxID=118357 RepID=A0A834GE39_RHOSS|nr:hypothetical protein RHSIM_Rhsim10G0032900 [Rhododendron simsii]